MLNNVGVYQKKINSCEDQLLRNDRLFCICQIPGEKREYSLIPIVKPGYANVCLTHPFSGWPEIKRYLITIAFHLCFRK